VRAERALVEWGKITDATVDDKTAAPNPPR